MYVGQQSLPPPFDQILWLRGVETYEENLALATHNGIVGTGLIQRVTVKPDNSAIHRRSIERLNATFREVHGSFIGSRQLLALTVIPKSCYIPPPQQANPSCTALGALPRGTLLTLRTSRHPEASAIP